MDGWKRGSCRGAGGGWARWRRDTWDGQVRRLARGDLVGLAANPTDVYSMPPSV